MGTFKDNIMNRTIHRIIFRQFVSSKNNEIETQSKYSSYKVKTFFVGFLSANLQYCNRQREYVRQPKPRTVKAALLMWTAERTHLLHTLRVSSPLDLFLLSVIDF